MSSRVPTAQTTKTAAPEGPVSTIKEWHTQDDLENDLWAYSEISLNKDDLEVPTPSTILEWNAQLEADRNCSIFDTPHDIDDDVTFIFSGRGRGGVSKLYRPGEPVESDLMEEKFIERKLREVSGLGYSNEYIESMVRAHQKNDREDFADAETDRTGALSSSSSSSSTSTSSPRPGGSRLGENNSSGQEYHLPLSSGRRAAVEKEKVVGVVVGVEEVPRVTPPPLSVIMGRSKPRTPGGRSVGTPMRPTEAPTVTDDSATTPSSSGAEDSSASNDFWWTNGRSSASNGDTDASDESPSWRRGPRGVGAAPGAGNWRRDFSRRERSYDIRSSNDFPPLG